MIPISPYHSIDSDHANQVGVAQKQQEKDEGKKVTVQDPEHLEWLRFERDRHKKENRKKKRLTWQKGSNDADEEQFWIKRNKRLLDVIV